MRRLRLLLVVAVLAAGWSVPAAAEGGAANGSAWGAFAEQWVGWVEGVWRVLAGSEGEVPPGDEVNGVAFDGSGEATSFGSPELKGEKFPGLDPDG